MRWSSEGYVVGRYGSVWRTWYGNASRVGYLCYRLDWLTNPAHIKQNPILYVIELRNKYYIKYRRGLRGDTRNF